MRVSIVFILSDRNNLIYYYLTVQEQTKIFQL